MKKVIIIGGGIAGMTAGIYLQKAGFSTEIYEKNAVPGGQCTGWKRDGYMIDNCIHWLTGTRPGSGLHELWKEVGALGEGIELYEKEKFFSTELNGEILTFWRDKERTRRELLLLSPEDEKEINQLMDMVALAESMQVPTEKPFDKMNLSDFVKLGMSMKDMGQVMKLYSGMDIKELAERFKHPLIQSAIIDYMPPGYQAYAFIVSYATVTGGNGDIPKGGSFPMALRMEKRYQELGGIMHLNAPVEKILVNAKNKKAEGILLVGDEKKKIFADYIICATDVNHTFTKLLDVSYMPKALCKQFEEGELYPVSSGFHVAFAVEDMVEELKETNLFSCKPLTVGVTAAERMSLNNYAYEPSFAPEGCTVLQSQFVQTQEDYMYWMELAKDKEAYKKKKEELANEVLERVLDKFPHLAGKIRILDCWTPATYTRYCNSYMGAYMSFVVTKKAKSLTVPGKIKGLSNVFIASQWLMGPGGLPTAAAMGKFAAYRVEKSSCIK